MYESIQNPFSSKLQSILNANYTKGRSLQTKRGQGSKSASVQYDVSSDYYKIFEFNTKTYSCGIQRKFGYPCQHLCAIIIVNDMNVPDFVTSERKLKN